MKAFIHRSSSALICGMDDVTGTD